MRLQEMHRQKTHSIGLHEGGGSRLQISRNHSQVKPSFGDPLCSPQGQVSISPSDREIVSQFGVSVIDCSWAKIESIPFSKIKRGYDRLRKGSLVRGGLTIGQCPCSSPRIR
jgi:hypothetical protein